jgi:hypothetical protein
MGAYAIGCRSVNPTQEFGANVNPITHPASCQKTLFERDRTLSSIQFSNEALSTMSRRQASMMLGM